MQGLNLTLAYSPNVRWAHRVEIQLAHMASIRIGAFSGTVIPHVSANVVKKIG
jgi:hypothetical protein